MNIYIAGPAYPYRGGIAKFNEVLGSTLQNSGHTVKLINFTLQYPSFLFPGKSQYTDSAPPGNLDIERCINSVNPVSWIQVGRMISRERPDMLIIRYWMPFMAPALGTIARLARKNGHTKVVALTDNVVPHEKHIYDKPMTHYFLGSLDGVVYMSEQVGSELNSFGFKGAKAFAPHPIYDTYGAAVERCEALKYLDLNPKYDYTLFFGFIRDYKGLDILLEAWAQLKADNRTSGRKLLVAGEYYGNRDKYEAMILKLGLESDIIVRDSYIPEDDVRYYFSASSLVVQPYRSATQSGVTQIAYHFAVPMIVTNVGGLAEIVPDSVTGYVTDCSSEAIATAIGRFWSDDQIAVRFRENILIERERFSWKRMSDTFLDIF